MRGKEWTNIQYFARSGEVTPFLFKGKEYYLQNLSAINHALAPGTPDHSIIMDAETGELVAKILQQHYFSSAYVFANTCFCFAARLENDHNWNSQQINVIQSQDLIHWTTPEPIFSSKVERFCNTAVTFDGKRHLLLYETDDPNYPKYTFKFLESEDLISWRPVERAIFGQSKYVGGPALYYLPEDGLFYLTYVNEFINPETGALNYNTRIARSKDLIYWEEGRRPVIKPDYSHRPYPEQHPEVYEINASDAEFSEIRGKVKVYCCGGNQQGIGDSAVAEYQGTMKDLFQAFFT